MPNKEELKKAKQVAMQDMSKEYPASKIVYNEGQIIPDITEKKKFSIAGIKKAIKKAKTLIIF